ncbi:hypothetical protein DL96DRAFT_1617063 [Flagelloscypha sp. PMI_526]|nr:hypothetical protein DL96DRAFT_1617063 [Flagelloscypha sp. PMI_526]
MIIPSETEKASRRPPPPQQATRPPLRIPEPRLPPSVPPPAYEDILLDSVSAASSSSGPSARTSPVTPSSARSTSLSPPSLPPRPSPIRQKRPAPPSHPTNTNVAERVHLAFPDPPTHWLKSRFQSSQYKSQLRGVIVEYIRDFVRKSLETSYARGESILSQCKNVCIREGMVFSDILQENILEDHTPLYWLVIQHPSSRYPQVSRRDVQDSLSLLLRFTSPLKPETVSQLRHACLVNDDHPLFYRLMVAPELRTVSEGNADLLYGRRGPLDLIDVHSSRDDSKAFIVQLTIHNFHQRMMVSKQVELDFIAKSRMWRVSFRTTEKSKPSEIPEHEWWFSVSLLDESLPTTFDSQLVFIPPSPESNSRRSHRRVHSLTPPPSTPSTFKSNSLPIPNHPYNTLSASSQTLTTQKSSSFISLLTTSKPIGQPKSPNLRVRTTKDLASSDRKRPFGSMKEVLVSLKESSYGDVLMDKPTPGNAPVLFGRNGELRCRWEVRLGVPEGGGDDGCIIC